MPQIQTLVKRLRTDDIAVQIEACRQLCDQLAEGENAPFGAIIAAGALPLLIQLVERVDAPALQYVAVRCITNLVTGGTVHTRAVVDDGAIAALVRLLIASRQVDDSDGLTQEAADCIMKAWNDHPIPDFERGRPHNRTVGVHALRHQALWALGNIAGNDDIKVCERVLDAGALPVVLAELERSPLAAGWKSPENQDYRVGDFVRVCGTVEAGTLNAGLSLPSGAKAIVESRDDTPVPTHVGGRFYFVRVPETGQSATVRANNMVHEPEMSKQRFAMWALQKLCRGRDRSIEIHLRAPLEQFEPVVPVIARILREATDVQLIQYATYVLRSLTENVPNAQLQAVLDTGVAPRLLEILVAERLCVDVEVAGVRVQSEHRKACIDQALAIVGNIVTGTEEQAQQLLDLGLLPRLFRILSTSSDERLRRTNRLNPRRIDACWTVSNICCGTEEQRVAVRSAGLFPQLASLLEDNAVGADAAWAFANSWQACSDEMARYLAHEVKPAVVPLLCSQFYATLTAVPFDDATGNPFGLSAITAIHTLLKKGRPAHEEPRGKNLYAELVDFGKINRAMSFSQSEALVAKAAEVMTYKPPDWTSIVRELEFACGSLEKANLSDFPEDVLEFEPNFKFWEAQQNRASELRRAVSNAKAFDDSGACATALKRMHTALSAACEQLSESEARRRRKDERVAAGVDGLMQKRPGTHYCPIGSYVMSDPVTDASGNTFERWEVERKIYQRGPDRGKVPLSGGTRLKNLKLRPNTALRDEIRGWDECEHQRCMAGLSAQEVEAARAEAKAARAALEAARAEKEAARAEAPRAEAREIAIANIEGSAKAVRAEAKAARAEAVVAAARAEAAIEAARAKAAAARTEAARAVAHHAEARAATEAAMEVARAEWEAARTSSSSLLDIKDQDSITLRFAVGDRVLCLCGTWQAGTVVKHFLVQKKFPPGKCAPYQVKLDDGRLIYAPTDTDGVIKRVDSTGPVIEPID